MSNDVIRERAQGIFKNIGLKDTLRFFLCVVKLLTGIIIFLFSRKTPAYAYQAMVSLFCMTKGISNEWMSRVISMVRQKPRAHTLNSVTRGVLGTFDSSQIQSITEHLDRYGYYVFDQKMSESWCDAVLKFSTSESSVIRAQPNTPVVYERGNPKGIRYDFSRETLLKSPEVKNVLKDPVFREISNNYLRTRALADTVEMWWHTDFSKIPDAEAAQFYHFDLDRIKWLKFFFYVTDVTPETGPHCFIAGSHRAGGIPSVLLKKGYARLSDEEVLRHYSIDQAKEFCALRGTVIAEDTRGFHKGKHVTKGDRLVFQLQFTNSAFGGLPVPPIELIHV